MSSLVPILLSTFLLSVADSLSAPACTDGSVRLQGSASEFQGRVEVCNRGVWGTVCDDLFTNSSASVVCSQLGFSSTGAQVITSGFSSAYFRQRIWLDDVMCSGVEDSIFDCNARPLGDHNCFHYEDVGVRCRPSCFGDIRLRGNNATFGRVEVFNGTVWGTVCDDWWSRNDATVACRQLGLNTDDASPLRLGNGYTQLPTNSSVPVFLDNLRCTGSESILAGCRHNGFGVHNCKHDEDAGLNCAGALNTLSQKLDEDEDAEEEMVKQEAGEVETMKEEQQQDKLSVLSLLEKILMEE